MFWEYGKAGLDLICGVGLNLFIIFVRSWAAGVKTYLRELGMYDKIVNYVQQYRMLEGRDGVVVGLSGGADSVCLLSVMSRMAAEKGFKLMAVHVHHGIRGAEADRDRDFCRKLCEKFNVPLTEYEYNVPEYAKEHGLGSEEAGRILRYGAFEKTAAGMGNAVTAVAHHMNDLAETVIFNMCRGSGIRGIRGIPPVRGRIIRPLLCCTREEIEEYIRKHGLDYCDDSTNDGTDYARNRIRHNVLPYLCENINSGAVANIAALAENAAKAEEYLEKTTKARFDAVVRATDGGMLAVGLEREDAYIAGRIVRIIIERMTGTLKDIGEYHTEGVLKLLEGRSGRRFCIKNGLTAVKNSDGIFFAGEHDINDIAGQVEITPPCIITPWEGAGEFTFEVSPWDKRQKISNEVYTKCFDYDKIKSGLCLRTRESGDYLEIDDKGHHKSLKQYFVDEGIPARRRERIPLLADGKHIMWIVGGRISAGYKITENTVNVLTVKYGGTRYGEN